MPLFPQIIDANVNRIAEGLRVIEEYLRFIKRDPVLTERLVHIRHQVNAAEPNPIANVASRDIEKDVRAKQPPSPRPTVIGLLKANFKRAEEGLRVMEEYTGNALYTNLRYDTYQLERDVLLLAAAPQVPRGIYLVHDQVDVLIQGAKNGATIVQLRDKGATKATLFDNATRLKGALPTGICFIVNDHLDIALAVDADGFHSGQDDIPIPEQRRLLGPDKIIGRTTHTLEQGLAAQADGADYISIGPIWDTPSKPDRPGIGLDYLSAAQTRFTIPYVAIGGINSTTIGQVLPFSPPIIGLIRDHAKIPSFASQWKLSQKGVSQ